MKTKIYTFLTIMALVSPFSVFASIDQNLRYGSSGQEVTELQEFLIDKGFLQGQASGNFYSLTRKAVVAYQTSVSLPSTGFVGPMTRETINSDLAKDTSTEEAQATPVVTPSVDTTSLLAKLADLQAQLKSMQDAQNVTQTQTNQILGSIAQNTTPAPVIQAVVEKPVDKSDIVITQSLGTPAIGFFYRPVLLTVSVLDKDGKNVIGANVLMNGENSTNWTNPPSPQMRTTGNNATFSFIPLSAGTKTITFTSGSLTKSIDVNVSDDPVLTDYSTRYNSTVTQINDLITQYNNVENDVNTEYLGRGATTGGIAPIIAGRKNAIQKQITDLQKLQEQLDSELRAKYQ